MKQNKILALVLLFFAALLVSACTNGSALTGNSNWPGLTVEGDTVYTSNANFVEAIKDGQKLWNYPEPANNKLMFFAAPAVDEKYVYAGTYNNQLHVISKADGTFAASVEVGNNKNKIIAAPLAADGNVFVVSSGGMVSCYSTDITNGTLQLNWQLTLSNEIWVKPEYFGGTLYVASMDKKMNIIDVQTGTLKETLPISGAVMSDPVLADGKLYFSTLAMEVDEMDLSSNEIRTVLTTDGEIWASPLLMGDKLIAADMNGVVYCVDLGTGDLLWKTEKLTGEKLGFIASPVALDEETILLVDENGEIKTYSAEGKAIRPGMAGNAVYTTPAVLENGSFVVIPQTTDGQIRVFKADMIEDWTYVRSNDKKEGK